MNYRLKDLVKLIPIVCRSVIGCGLGLCARVFVVQLSYWLREEACLTHLPADFDDGSKILVCLIPYTLLWQATILIITLLG